MNEPPRALWALSVACCMLGACALLSRGEPMVVRYYTPEAEASASAARPTPADAATPGPLRLRLGSVSSAAYLRERIAVRLSAHELRYDEDRRWTERPERYLRRAVERALFEQRGIVRVVEGPAPALELELLAFDEVQGPPHRVQLRVTATLVQGRIDAFTRTLAWERPVAMVRAGDASSAVASALGETLRIAAEQIASLVVEQLAAQPAPQAATTTAGEP